MVNSVTVLTPNGRRQTVNVTPNSTVLQILEEVCTKHDFQPLDYDIRHHNNILDTTMTIQFSRLPNNAQLEMVKAKKIRKESEVLVNIQIESGKRLSGSFLPSVCLWEVVTQLCPDACGTSKLPTVLYMRQEICGIENLKATTLRSLGLTNGRALFRLTCRSIEGEVPKQPTGNLANYGVASTSNQRDSSVFSDSQNMNKEGNMIEKVKKDSVTAKRTSDTGAVPKSLLAQKDKVAPIESVKPLAKKHREKMDIQECPDKSSVSKHYSVVDEATTSQKQNTETIHATTQGAKPNEVKFTSQEVNVSSLEEMFNEEIEPRDRNPVIFKHGSQLIPSGDDLPDEFFELTLDDVRNLYRDLKTKHLEINESPLQTSALRKLEDSKRILNQLHKYKRAVLRIQFPDQIILQGSFSPVETIESVHKFVKSYLLDPTVPFYLFTTPPKEILTPSSRLIEVNCVPCALLYFGVPDDLQKSTNFLRPEVLSELSSLEVATAAASQSRGLPAGSKKNSVPSTSGVGQSHASTSGTQASKGNKGSECASSSGNNPNKSENPNGKVPKWFKLGPK